MTTQSDTQKLFRVKTLLAHHKASHDLSYWLRHEYTATLSRGLTTYCVCESCCAEMIALVEQWERDYDSRLESLRMTRNAFLGFDPDDEWRRRSS